MRGVFAVPSRQIYYRAIFRTNCATLNASNSCANSQICAALVQNFRGWAIIFQIFVKGSLNLLIVLHISIYNTCTMEELAMLYKHYQQYVYRKHLAKMQLASSKKKGKQAKREQCGILKTRKQTKQKIKAKTKKKLSTKKKRPQSRVVPGPSTRSALRPLSHAIKDNVNGKILVS